MRIFGLIGLVVALAIVGILASRQLKSVGAVSSAPVPEGTTVREQAQNVQQSVKQAVDANLQIGVQRREEQDAK